MLSKCWAGCWYILAPFLGDGSSFIYHNMYGQLFCSRSCDVILLGISDIFQSASRSPIFAVRFDPWYTGQEARTCFDSQPRGHDLSSVILSKMLIRFPTVEWISPPFSFFFSLAPRPERYLLVERSNEIVDTFFFHSTLHLPAKVSIIFRFKCRHESWHEDRCFRSFLNMTSIVLHVTQKYRCWDGVTSQTRRVASYSTIIINLRQELIHQVPSVREFTVKNLLCSIYVLASLHLVCSPRPLLAWCYGISVSKYHTQVVQLKYLAQMSRKTFI